MNFHISCRSTLCTKHSLSLASEESQGEREVDVTRRRCVVLHAGRTNAQAGIERRVAASIARANLGAITFSTLALPKQILRAHR